MGAEVVEKESNGGRGRVREADRERERERVTKGIFLGQDFLTVLTSTMKRTVRSFSSSFFLFFLF